MPILAKEPDLYPTDLLEHDLDSEESGRNWWAMYTISRREKQLMRRLLSMDISFYGPLISRRSKSPAGRVRESHVPLFPNYVFIYGNEFQCQAALSSNCVSRWFSVLDSFQLTSDLKQIFNLIKLGRPLTPESRLMNGDRVRVLNGLFVGFEGMVVRREGEKRLLVAVDFMQQGASVLLDDCQLEPLN